MKDTAINYLKNIIKVILWPILFIVGQFLILIIFTYIFNTSLNIETDKLSEYINTIEYQTKLNNFLSDYKLLIVIITVAIFLPIFLKLFKQFKNKEVIKLKGIDILLLVILGLTICFIFNIGLFYLNKAFKIMGFLVYDFSIDLLIAILCTGILGSVLEELLFRGIVYNRLKLLEPKNAMIMGSLIFALMHTNYINMIYAFFIGLLLIYVYEKYKTIKASIILHITANTSNLLFLKLIVTGNIIVNSILLIIMILGFVYAFKKINKKFSN